MFSDNIKKFLIYNNNVDFILFKSAINYAELGLNVWFISPEPIQEIPDNINIPDKEVLKLITFLYLKDYSDLISHVNQIHCWHKIPHAIIIHKFDYYIELHGNKNKHASFGPYITASLINALSTSFSKYKTLTFLLLSYNDTNRDSLVQLQSLVNLFDLKVVETENVNCDIVVRDIFSCIT